MKIKGKIFLQTILYFLQRQSPRQSLYQVFQSNQNPRKAFKLLVQQQEIQKKTETSSKPSPVVGSFGSKLDQMNEMFKNKILERNGTGGHRLSMMIGVPQNFKFGKGGPSLGSSGGGGKNSDIIIEEPDKMKQGYDPTTNLQKALDS